MKIKMLVLLGVLTVNSALANTSNNTKQIHQKIENICITEMKQNKRIWVDWLYLENCNLQDEEIPAVIDYLKGKPQLTGLDLKNNNLHQKAAQLIAQGTSIELLWLDNNFIGNEGAKALAETQNEKLKNLYLVNNQIGDEGAKALAKNTHFDYLWLNQNPISKEGAIAFRDNVTLTTLGLCEDPLLGDEGALELAKSKSLKVLCLWSDNLTSRGTMNFADSTIDFLRLDDNPLTDKVTPQFVNFKGDTLVLDNCQIGDEGVQNLIKNHTTKNLSLGRNQITDYSVRLLANVNTTFGTVWLDHNHITDKYLSDYIDNPSIWHLDLGYTDITDAGIKALIQNRHAFRSLYVNHNQLTNESAFAIVKDSILYNLEVAYNHIGPSGIKKLKSRHWNHLDVEGNDGPNTFISPSDDTDGMIRLFQNACHRNNKYCEFLQIMKRTNDLKR